MTLSPRQLQIIRLIASGATAKEIAGELACGEPTVRKHINVILIKLEARTQAQAVWLWSRNMLRKSVKTTE